MQTQRFKTSGVKLQRLVLEYFAGIWKVLFTFGNFSIHIFNKEVNYNNYIFNDIIL
jgi:hypothetical protein